MPTASQATPLGLLNVAAPRAAPSAAPATPVPARVITLQPWALAVGEGVGVEVGELLALGVGLGVAEAPVEEEGVGVGVREGLGHSTRRTTLLLPPPSAKYSTPVPGWKATPLGLERVGRAPQPSSMPEVPAGFSSVVVAPLAVDTVLRRLLLASATIRLPALSRAMCQGLEKAAPAPRALSTQAEAPVPARVVTARVARDSALMR